MPGVVKANPQSYSDKNICGRSKKQSYNGSWFHSSWEIQVARWLDASNVRWTRTVTPIEYIWNNSTHLYFPDFYLEDEDLFIEVKGYETDRDHCKWAYLPNLVVIRKAEIELIKDGKLSLDILRGKERLS